MDNWISKHVPNNLKSHAVVTDHVSQVTVAYLIRACITFPLPTTMDRGVVPRATRYRNRTLDHTTSHKTWFTSDLIKNNKLMATLIHEAYIVKKLQTLEQPPCISFCLVRARSLVAKHLRCYKPRCPEPIIVSGNRRTSGGYEVGERTVSH